MKTWMLKLNLKISLGACKPDDNQDGMEAKIRITWNSSETCGF
jgi:hypothetical protein